MLPKLIFSAIVVESFGWFVRLTQVKEFNCPTQRDALLNAEFSTSFRSKKIRACSSVGRVRNGEGSIPQGRKCDGAEAGSKDFSVEKYF